MVLALSSHTQELSTADSKFCQRPTEKQLLLCCCASTLSKWGTGQAQHFHHLSQMHRIISSCHERQGSRTEPRKMTTLLQSRLKKMGSRMWGHCYMMVFCNIVVKMGGKMRLVLTMASFSAIQTTKQLAGEKPSANHPSKKVLSIFAPLLLQTLDNRFYIPKPFSA